MFPDNNYRIMLGSFFLIFKKCESNIKIIAYIIFLSLNGVED